MKKHIQYKNSLLVYHVYGSGIPVVLLHGFGETNSIWKNQTAYLKSNCRLIIPDLPGSGESELPGITGKNLEMGMLAEGVLAILSNEEIKQCIMLGHSMGGYVTLAFAGKYPEKLKAFGFVHSTAFADSDAKKQDRAKGIEAINLNGSHAFLKNMLPGLFAEEFKKRNPAAIDTLIEQGRHFKETSLQQYYHAMMERPDTTGLLKNGKLPVLFVMGTEDRAAPLNDLLKQAHLPEIAYIHIIPGVAHMGMLEAPEKLNGILKSFINAFD
ncbi:MAG TPA: alpha/beta hydrolase [Parafilimonas sp.]|nr:alpha/beta hydrolase [Parafilimonas sp.]